MRSMSRSSPSSRTGVSRVCGSRVGKGRHFPVPRLINGGRLGIGPNGPPSPSVESSQCGRRRRVVIFSCADTGTKEKEDRRKTPKYPIGNSLLKQWTLRLLLLRQCMEESDCIVECQSPIEIWISTQLMGSWLACIAQKL